MQIAGIHHVTLIVDDHDRAAWFYGQVLGLEARRRPDFDFPGLFYQVGSGQEVHLIVSARPREDAELVIRRSDGAELSLRHVHRHAALRVKDLTVCQQRLEDHGVEVLFSATRGDHAGSLTENMMAGWRAMYGGIPLFCKDPSGNLIELVPASAATGPAS